MWSTTAKPVCVYNVLSIFIVLLLTAVIYSYTAQSKEEVTDGNNEDENVWK